MERVVYYNGVFSREDDIAISPFNRGLLYGDGVFETLRTYGGRAFRLDRHLTRLAEGLRILRINSWWKRDEIEIALCELLRINKLSDASARITVFRGDGDGPEPEQDVRASILVSVKPGDYYREDDYEKGFRAYLTTIRRNIYSPLSRIKSLNYLDNILGRLEARDHNAREALFLNTEGRVAEGAVSNIFIIKDNKLITPPVDVGILPGITREAVLEIAEQVVQETGERAFSVEELLHSDEAFLTNSIMEIMPLTFVNDKPIGKGTPGPVTKKLLDRYRHLVRKELELSV